MVHKQIIHRIIRSSENIAVKQRFYSNVYTSTLAVCYVSNKYNTITANVHTLQLKYAHSK